MSCPHCTPWDPLSLLEDEPQRDANKELIPLTSPIFISLSKASLLRRWAKLRSRTIRSYDETTEYLLLKRMIGIPEACPDVRKVVEDWWRRPYL